MICFTVWYLTVYAILVYGIIVLIAYFIYEQFWNFSTYSLYYFDNIFEYLSFKLSMDGMFGIKANMSLEKALFLGFSFSLYIKVNLAFIDNYT